MLLERAGGSEKGWHDLSNHGEQKDFLARSWPTGLCSTDEASHVAVSLTPGALEPRYKQYLKGKVRVGKA